MAVPKKRKSYRRTHLRRAHLALQLVNMHKCKTCGNYHKSHFACKFCGYYNNRLIIRI